MAPVKEGPSRDERLTNAVQAVRVGEKSVRIASRDFKIPFETLRRHVTGESLSTKRGPPPKLGQTTETDLTVAVKEMVGMAHGVGMEELRQLGMEINEAQELESFKNDLPSRGWARKFLKRNNLTLRTPENVSSARLNSEKPEIVKDFYDKLESLFAKLKPLGLTGMDIYNTDETGLCIVSKSGKVIATKGARKVRTRTSGERGQNVTVLATANATGNIILPPTVIFRGETLNEDLMKGAPEGTYFSHSKKSFIDKELFELWFDRFLLFIPQRRPVILIMDGHASHISYNIIKKAMENGIHILLFPPHTTHLFQPMDLGVFGPLKSAFNKECRKLIKRNKLKHLERKHFCAILKLAWERAVTPVNVASGFLCGGVWPFDRNRVIVPCDISIPTPDLLENVSALSSLSDQVLDEGNGQASEEIRIHTVSVIPSETPSCSFDPLLSPVVSVVRQFLTPEETASEKSKRITKARMITSEEFAREMEEKESQKKQKEKEKQDKLEERKKRQEETKRKKEEQKKIQEEKKKQAGEKRKTQRPRRRQGGRKEQIESENLDNSFCVDDPPENDKENVSPNETEAMDAEDSTLCGLCSKSFQNDFNGESWIQCVLCKQWFHNKCQNLGEKEYRPDFKCLKCNTGPKRSVRLR